MSRYTPPAIPTPVSLTNGGFGATNASLAAARTTLGVGASDSPTLGGLYFHLSGVAAASEANWQFVKGSSGTGDLALVSLDENLANPEIVFEISRNGAVLDEFTVLNGALSIYSDNTVDIGAHFEVDTDGNTTATSFSGLGSGLTGITPTQVGAQPKATTAQLLAQSAAVTSVVAVTAPNDAANHLYTCGGTITVTAISANTIALQVTYTDETNASRTQSFFGEGLTVAAVSTTGGFTFPPLTVWAKPNTAVTIKTVVTGVGSETYDVAGWIQQLD